MSLLKHSLLIESTNRSAKALRFGFRAGKRTGFTLEFASQFVVLPVALQRCVAYVRSGCHEGGRMGL
jgi:hypothetical protein